MPIVRGPLPEKSWEFAKAFSIEVVNRYPELATSIYKVAIAPRIASLVDYNQNAWKPHAGIRVLRAAQAGRHGFDSRHMGRSRARNQNDDFTVKTVPARLAKLGDLWKPVLAERGPLRLGENPMTLPLAENLRTHGS